ncbi:MAG: diguanylate cyclase [Rhodocyclales bacterium]|nr:diguanylate cyclase [Rhodocyclales bacterium]
MRLKYFWLIPLVFWGVVVGASFRWNWHQLDQQVFETAANHGRDIFRMVEAMRLWNSLHGGLYVVQSEMTPPNPYLDVPERDPVTTSGKKLTMVNPAYMTRQMSGTILEQTGIRVRITSLKPINPGNQADPWEASALRRFEQGLKEYAEVLPGENALVRYMAPLVTHQACLTCHAKQGYRVGDIRGGISVSFAAAPIEAAIIPHRKTVLFGHILSWAGLVLLTIYAMRRIRTHVAALERARAEQEQLVELRTAELRAEAGERRQAESQLRHLVDSTSGGIIGVDAEGSCLVCNPMAARLLGLAETQMLHGAQLAPILAGRSPKLASMLLNALDGVPRAEEAVSVAVGTETNLSVEVRVDPIVESGHVMGAVISLVDATERQARQREIWRQANFDHLTGLANRSLFLDRLERTLALQARAGRTAAVLFIDLDGFKPVNDRYGHATGDAVLIEVARRLSSAVRSTDVAARFGGDEFVLGVADVASKQDVAYLAQKVLDAINAPYRIGDIRAELSASIGIALFPEDQQTTDMLLAASDEAMYHAKQAGKARCCYYAQGQFRSSL